MEARDLDGGQGILGHNPDYQAELRRPQARGGAEQRGDARGSEPVALGGDDVEEGQVGAGDLGEGGVEGARRDVAEGELREVPPEAAPAARDQACVGGSAGAAEAGEDVEEQIVGEAAEAVHSAAADAGAGHDAEARALG